MVRSFQPRPLPWEVVERLVANALRAPSAGHTQGSEFLLLEGPEETGRFWDATFPAQRRRKFRWPGLFSAPVIIVCLSNKQAYLERYREPDKRRADDLDELWSIPYWHIDASFAALLMLLTAADAGLGALFFRVHDHPAFRAAFGVPERYEPVGAIAVGFPAPDRPSRSLRRRRRALEEVVHRGRW